MLADFKKKWLLLILYFSANALFAYKYGARVPTGSYLALAAYALFFTAVIAVYIKLLSSKIENMKPAHFAFIYWGALGFFVIAALALHFKIDPYTLRVDRWSALHAFISSLFAGKYPYIELSHMGGQVSPLPVMNFIAIPFYLMGDVGYLQIFVFAAAAFAIFFSEISRGGKVIFMAAFLLSPAFWYEVAVRSDMVSNILLMCLCMLYIEKSTNGNPLNHPVKTGVISGLLFSTRGIFIIPFTVFFFARVISAIKEAGILRAFYFTAATVLTFALTLLPFILWDAQLFMQHNPLTPQTDKAPMAVQISAGVLALLLSFNARSAGSLFIRNAVCLFALMSTTIIMKIFAVGWDGTFFHHSHSSEITFYNQAFDLVYYSIIIPFIVFGVLFGNRPVTNNSLLKAEK